VLQVFLVVEVLRLQGQRQVDIRLGDDRVDAVEAVDFGTLVPFAEQRQFEVLQQRILGDVQLQGVVLIS